VSRVRSRQPQIPIRPPLACPSHRASERRGRAWALAALELDPVGSESNYFGPLLIRGSRRWLSTFRRRGRQSHPTAAAVCDLPSAVIPSIENWSSSVATTGRTSEPEMKRLPSEQLGAQRCLGKLEARETGESGVLGTEGRRPVQAIQSLHDYLGPGCSKPLIAPGQQPRNRSSQCTKPRDQAIAIGDDRDAPRFAGSRSRSRTSPRGPVVMTGADREAGTCGCREPDSIVRRRSRTRE